MPTVASMLPAVVLRNLATIRVRTGIKDRDVVSIMKASGRHDGFTLERYRKLALGSRKSEPWYDEARDLSRILLLDGILPLVSDFDVMPGEPYPSGTLTSFNIGEHTGLDLVMLRVKARMPLTVAMRLAARFGLNDPIELEQTPHLVQLWDTLASGERGGDAQCPWCREHTGTGAAHLPTCLGENLLGARTEVAHSTAGFPQPARASGKRASGAGRGVAHMRKLSRLTQVELGDRAGINSVYLSKIESGAVSLTEDKARALVRVLGCSMQALYDAPEGDDA